MLMPSCGVIGNWPAMLVRVIAAVIWCQRVLYVVFLMLPNIEGVSIGRTRGEAGAAGSSAEAG